MRLTKKQLKERREAVMASDVPTILGLNKFQTPLELGLVKMGQIVPDQKNVKLSTSIGHLVEPITKKLWEKETGRKARAVRVSSYREDKPHHGATPDFEIVDTKQLLETKYSTNGPLWARLPDPVFVQVQWQMYVCQKEECDVAALIAYKGTELKTYVVPRHDEFINEIIKLVEIFWQGLKEGKLPVSTGTDAEAKAIGKLFSQQVDDEVIESDDVDLIETLDVIGDLDARVKQLKGEKTKLQNNIKMQMQTAPTLIAGQYRVRWSKPREKTLIDYSKVVDDLVEFFDRRAAFSQNLLVDEVVSMMDESIGSHTSRKENARRFTIRGGK